MRRQLHGYTRPLLPTISIVRQGFPEQGGFSPAYPIATFYLEKHGTVQCKDPGFNLSIAAIEFESERLQI